MKRDPVPPEPQDAPAYRVSEARLAEIRRQAGTHGRVDGRGIQPPGAPFPVATPETGYYGLPLLKSPPWTWEVPTYFFVGGAAGAAALIGAVANLTNADRNLVRDANILAAVGGAISPALLTSDLGRSARFFNMLRVFKLQSPMSVGSWTLVVFSTSAAAAAFAEALAARNGRSAPLRVMGNAAQVLSAASGLVLSTYTGVLIGATAIPVWNEHVGLLPIHFAASGLGSAVSLLELRGHDRSRALNTLGIASAAVETLIGARTELEKKPAKKALTAGKVGWLTRLGGILSGPLPLALRLLAGSSGKARSRKLRRAAAVSTIAGSMLTRVAWIEAGRASAKDPTIPLHLPPPQLEQRRLQQ